MIVCFAAAIILILVLGLCWRLENRRRDRLQSETPQPEDMGDGKAAGEQAFEEDLTDKQNISFRYVY
jgi:hypothetical protein